MREDKSIRYYIDGEGKTLATLAESEKPEDELCDFCSCQNKPFVIFPCKDFIISKDPPLTSLGEWNACPRCAALIDADDRLGLLNRSASILDVEINSRQYHSIREIQEGFFNNKV